MLTDDAAILRLIDRLRNNPPSLQKRLEEADRDKDGSISRLEFIGFLEELGVPDQDLMCLARVAGYTAGKKAVRIQDFKDILRARPQAREAEQKSLAAKIRKIIEQKYKTL